MKCNSVRLTLPFHGALSGPVHMLLFGTISCRRLFGNPFLAEYVIFGTMLAFLEHAVAENEMHMMSPQR